MPDPSPAATLLFLREEELRQGIDLLYFAARDFSHTADALLAEQGLERVHHRILHFVGARPQMPVTELATILAITKQSLGRALETLLEQGMIVQKPGTSDRRQRLLSLTEQGAAFEKQINDRFRSRLAKAYRDAGGPAVEGFRKVMLELIEPEDRRRFERQGAPGR
ncbi:MAG TPA: MarR family transcriptional regulator [Stellaceae bacterium]|jgi:DNA-binding MarR family transcriptional regulator|nr:MarR family transcriptional regulator [Stellaceae bacterium]